MAGRISDNKAWRQLFRKRPQAGITILSKNGRTGVAPVPETGSTTEAQITRSSKRTRDTASDSGLVQIPGNTVAILRLVIDVADVFNRGGHREICLVKRI